MQTLVDLLLELKAAAAAPDGPARLRHLAAALADPLLPAELQVARHYLARLLLPSVEEQVHDLDPAVRRGAIATAVGVLPRNAAARVLRRVVKDPDPKVRRAARTAVRKLGIDDVAPPDVRFLLTEGSPRGGHNVTGWAFGTFARDRVARPAPRPPSRPSALDAHGLPRLATPADVARLVGVPEAELPSLMRPGTARGSGYVEFEIAKAKGGTRRIAAPRGPLRRVQRKILDEILAKVPVHDACHGFVAGRSTVTNARPHERAAIVVKVDLKDFFPTVHFRRVRGLFVQLGYGAEVAATLAGLTTYRPKLGAQGKGKGKDVVLWPGVLPQGAPTSPAIANLACRRLDARLARLAARCGAVYTRYADDLTFSFAQPPEVRLGRFLWWIDAICQQEGFSERPDKRRVLRAKHQQRVTGLVVNARASVPREDRRRFRAILHNCARHGVASQARDRDGFEAYLAGYAAYVNMVDPVLGRRLLDEVARLLGEARA